MCAQVVCALDKALLDAFGFSVDVEHALRLAPAPECGSAEVAITLNTASKHVSGCVAKGVPLLFRMGG